MKFLRHVEKVIGKYTRRNMPVKSPVSKKSSEPVILKSVTVLIGEISKKLPSRKSGGSVQEIFQKAQEAARKSVKATEKLRQKAPPQIQSALPEGASFSILTIILTIGGVLIISALAPIFAPIVILFGIASMIFSDD